MIILRFKKKLPSKQRTFQMEQMNKAFHLQDGEYEFKRQINNFNENFFKLKK